MAYSISDLHRNGAPSLIEHLRSQDQWPVSRSSLLKTWLDYIGGVPERTEVSCETLSEVKMEGHYRRHIRYSTAYDDWVSAYLLLPADYVERPTAVPASGFPAILALHPAFPSGKEHVVVGEGKYGLELVQRGYVVLAPDTPEMGEREGLATSELCVQYPTWSPIGKMVTDHQYGLDLLCAMERVDPRRIGAIGHSLGAYNAFFLAGLDSRIRAFAVSCGFSTFAGDPRPNRWGLGERMNHLPRLTADLERGKVPFELNEIAALAAPTPAFFWSGQEDHVFPHWKEISTGMEQLKRLYVFLGKGERFEYWMGSTGHVFPDEVRELAYRFLDRWLIPEVERGEKST
ncbi:alpha/beta hydrolase family protein [Paenibacillus koleovorans]|uniref:alpha/beta hydrolase family protein n=1 Tax=Paenibacillus koleovorans TaxID=121608 RepID=UPI000FDC9540|nr:alpha/beta fold hydrolase [Paenibacillus koleovorans]